MNRHRTFTVATIVAIWLGVAGWAIRRSAAAVRPVGPSVATAVAESGGLAPGVWPMLGASGRHASTSLFTGPATNELAWQFETDGLNRGPRRSARSRRFEGGVAIDVDGTVYFGSPNGRLFAVEQDGRRRWMIDNLGSVIGVPALSQRDRLYVTTVRGELSALDARTGAVTWTFDAHARISGSPVVGPDGSVYFATRSKGIFAVHADGTLRWRAAAVQRLETSPTIGADGTVFAATTHGHLLALNTDGTLRWDRLLAAMVRLGTAAIGNGGRLYVGGSDGRLRALDVTTGVAIWTYPLGRAIRGGISLGPNGDIYVGTEGRTFFLVHDAGAEAELRWTTELGARMRSTAAVDGSGAVYIGADDGKIYALEASDGAVRWSFATNGPVRSALAIGIGGRVFATSSDHQTYAIGEFRGGKDCWHSAFFDTDGLSEEEASRRFQTLLAACGGPDVAACEAIIQGSANADRILAARKLVAGAFEAGNYLAVVRDRSRKLRTLGATGDDGFCEAVGHDADGDLVPDGRDACRDTPPLTATDDDGCTNLVLPAAPSTEQVRAFLAASGFVFDDRCGAVPPEQPVPAGMFIFPTRPQTEKIVRIVPPENQAPECGIWYEVQILWVAANGELQTYNLVLQSSKATRVNDGKWLQYNLLATDPGVLGAFAAASVGPASGNSRYRVRATNYAGHRSLWSRFKITTTADCLPGECGV